MHPEEGGLEILSRTMDRIGWIEGPKFLYKPEEDWPVNMVDTAVGVEDLEVKKEAFVNVVNTQGSLKGTNRLMAYFSDWRRLRVSVAWLLKLKRMLLRRICKRRVRYC